MTGVKILTDDNFEKEVLKNHGFVLVDFWADWCAPCKTIASILEEIALEYHLKLKVLKLDIDKNPVTAIKYSIMSIPTLIIFSDGEAVKRLYGALPKSKIVKEIAEIVSK